MPQQPALSLVIPAYNEARRIGPTVHAVRAWMDAQPEPASYELLVVDEGSTDETSDTVRAHAEEDPRVAVLRVEQNRGKGAAVRAGVRVAKGARVLFMDADLATPLSEVALLEGALSQGADIAIATRREPHGAAQRSRARRTMAAVFNGVVRALTGLPYRDTQCGFKLFSSDAARELFGRSSVDGFAFDVELLLLARGRFRVTEVPVRWSEVPGSKVSPLRDALGMSVQVALLRLRLGPAPRP